MQAATRSTTDLFPRGTAISAPTLVYRGAMLAGSPWLALLRRRAVAQRAEEKIASPPSTPPVA